MKFHSLRNLLAAFTVSCAAVLLSSCGGGGAGGNPNLGGAISLTPLGENTILFAGVPFTFTISGGRPPYAMTSSIQSILPVCAIVEGHTCTVVPNNPGVVDSGLSPGELPVRTITITARDATGVIVSVNVRVAQNFLTGYGIAFVPTNCPSGSAGSFNPSAQACAGGQTAIQMQANFQGNLAGNRTFRFEVLRGNFSLRNAATGQAGATITAVSDHSGTVTALIEVPPNVPTQLGVLRVVDVATGVYSDTVFTISGFSQSQNITPIPNTFSFTGALTTECGTGSADFMVFDGVPPYTASSTNPNLRVTPSTFPSNPARFTVEAFNRFVCLDDATIIVTDARGGRGTVTVDTARGSTAPPTPVAMSIGPTTLTLGCGQTGSIAVVGGSGSYFTVSTNPNVSATVSGNTVSITRAGPAGPGSGGTLNVALGISDGTTIQTATVTVPTTCP